MKFKAIIFDFGNVIIDIDIPRTFQNFARFTGKKVDVVERLFAENQVFRRYELGLFNDEEFREVVRQILGFPLSDYEIDTSWNALLLEIPKKRLELLQRLREKYPIFLLSNTNHIHIQESEKYLKKTFGIASLSHIFDEVFLSYEAGFWKPDAAFYHYVLDKIGFSAKDVLFLDDNLKNVESARNIGIPTIWVEPPKCITTYFEEIKW
jgi:epoxide hydrolase-like predicted phosphatase